MTIETQDYLKLMAERDRYREALGRLQRVGQGSYVALSVADDEFVREVWESVAYPTHTPRKEK